MTQTDITPGQNPGEAAAHGTSTTEVPPNPRKQAQDAKYRERLREAEAERDRTAARLAAQQTEHLTTLLVTGVEVQPPAGGVYGHNPGPVQVVMHDGADLCRFTDRQAADFYDDAGRVDQESVQAAASDLYAERPYLFRVSARRRTNAGRTPSKDRSDTGWRGAFGPR